MQLVHATSVEIGGHAVVIRAPSGGGKSDLALRLIDGSTLLVADDQTQLPPRMPTFNSRKDTNARQRP